MKVLIAGDPVRGKQWEKYLRKKHAVHEVIIAKDADNSEPDAVVLLDDSTHNLEHLLKLIRRGIHTYLVSALPTNADQLKTIYHASEEANVSIQFSHWASFSPMTRWTMKNSTKIPRFTEILKSDLGRTLPDPIHFRQLWIDEVAYVLTLHQSTIQQIAAHPLSIKNRRAGIYISIRFINGSVASIRYLGISVRDQHERIIQAEHSIIQCNIIRQKATLYTVSNRDKLLDAEHLSFDTSATADNSLEYFLRSVKTYKSSGFSVHTALQTARAVRRIDEELSKA